MHAHTYVHTAHACNHSYVHTFTLILQADSSKKHGTIAECPRRREHKALYLLKGESWGYWGNREVCEPPEGSQTHPPSVPHEATSAAASTGRHTSGSARMKTSILEAAPLDGILALAAFIKKNKRHEWSMVAREMLREVEWMGSWLVLEDDL